MIGMYQRGYAFVLEGDTEKVFYLSFLRFLAKKHGASLERRVDPDTPDVVYLLHREDAIDLIKMHTVNAISQMPGAWNWVNSQCIRRYDKEMAWTVFLCYDMDSYQADVTAFQEGDWRNLRRKIRKTNEIIDMAARADIEDLLLTDLRGVCDYLGIEEVPDHLPGRKGKAKMKRLFRSCGAGYQEGERAAELIEALDMQLIMKKTDVPLSRMELCFFD